MQEIIIIAEPNGAGKTSFAKEYLPAAREGLVYVNADEIARELAAPNLTEAHLNLRAGREMLSRIDRLVSARSEFMFETTLASLSYARKIPIWRARGYTVALIYLRLPSVDAAIDRVNRRVAARGSKSLGRLMGKVVDIGKVQRALDRAARNARYGSQEARSGQMLPVESSMMTGLNYDEATCELDILFSSGKTYRYFDVPADVYARLLEAGSKGQFFNEEIKEAYRYAEVTKRRR